MQGFFNIFNLFPIFKDTLSRKIVKTLLTPKLKINYPDIDETVSNNSPAS